MLINQQFTAVMAYHKHTSGGLAQGQRMRILELINDGESWSIGEIAHALQMQKSTV